MKPNIMSTRSGTITTRSLMVVLLVFLLSSSLYVQLNPSGPVDDIQDQNITQQPHTDLAGTESSFDELDDQIRHKIQHAISTELSGFIPYDSNNTGLTGDIQFVSRSMDIIIGFSQSSVLFAIPTDLIADNLSPVNIMAFDEPNSAAGVDLPQFQVFELNFPGSNEVAPVAGRTTDMADQFQVEGGPDGNHITAFTQYQEIIFPDIYDNIDLHYLVQDGKLKYEFVVHPGGDYHDIQLSWSVPAPSNSMAYKLEVNQQPSGMTIQVSHSEIRSDQKSTDYKTMTLYTDANPINYLGTDRTSQLDGRFRQISSNVYGFDIDGSTDNLDEDLIIDPYVLPTYSTYLGGTENDQPAGLFVDSQDNIYFTGSTYSTDFPTLDGYNDSLDGSYGDAFIAKFNSTGDLQFSTYLGGTDADSGSALTIDSSGNIHIVGKTRSLDFPTVSAYQSNTTYDYDVFHTIMNSSGNGLLYSSYLGGNGSDYVTGIALDSEDNAYIHGHTSSDDFPVKNAFNDTRSSIGTRNDIFLAKFSKDGDLGFSTYLGSYDGSNSGGIAIDSSDNIILTGYTSGDGFPIRGGFNETIVSSATSTRVYLSKFNSTGSLKISTFFGGNSSDYAKSITIDDDNNVYLTGYTSSTNYPLVRANQSTVTGIQNVFVTKINANFTDFIFSTYLGGSRQDWGHDISLDSEGNTYIIGYTNSDDYPTVYQNETNAGDGTGIFLSVLGPNGTKLLHSTIYGGTSSGSGTEIVVTSGGKVVITGWTSSSDFPTLNSYQNESTGSRDVVLVVFAPDWKLPIYNNSPADLTYEFGSTGNQITFEGHDDFPGTYVIYLNHTKIAVGTWQNNRTQAYNVDGFDLGLNLITIQLLDKFGNYRNESLRITVVDTTRPQFLGTPTDTVYGIGSYLQWYTRDFWPGQYYLYRNNSLIQTGLWNNTHGVTYKIEVPTLGVYNFSLIIKDTSGNNRTDAFQINVIDSTRPELHTDQETYSVEYGDSTQYLVWNMTDHFPDHFMVYRNGTELGTGMWNNSGLIAVQIGKLPIAMYNYTLTAFDTSDNYLTTTIMVNISDTTPPVITSFPLSSMSGNQTTLVWTATDLLPDSYNIYYNGTNVYSGTWDNNTDIFFDLQLLGLQNGSVEITIEIADTSGNSVIDTHRVEISPDMIYNTSDNNDTEDNLEINLSPDQIQQAAYILSGIGVFVVITLIFMRRRDSI